MYVYVLNPGGRYCNYVFCGIGVGLLHVAIGGFLMVIMCFYIQENAGDIHVPFCALGFHFFLAEGLLALHYANGWTAPMRLRHRKFAHIFLSAFGTLFVLIGAILAIINKGFSVNPHALAGLITTILVVLSTILGPFAYRKSSISSTSKVPEIIHTSFGIFTFFMSSVCVYLGITTESFQNWAGDGTVIITAALVSFYTVYIVISAFMKCVTRL